MSLNHNGCSNFNILPQIPTSNTHSKRQSWTRGVCPGFGASWLKHHQLTLTSSSLALPAPHREAVLPGHVLKKGCESNNPLHRSARWPCVTAKVTVASGLFNTACSKWEATSGPLGVNK